STPDNIIIVSRGVELGTYASDGYRKILRSTDAGISWTTVDACNKMFSTENQMQILKNSTERYTLTKLENDHFLLYTSLNNGATWQERKRETGVSGKLMRANGDNI